ncbi:helix-hairpin-helix domain-containing protein [Methylobacterium nigriterrae]|uniref:helix-hairpin-helix domain-containing protein n=1 Tax=Methylobacterium nigriterrae TaxID=3127512 RepID=UPI003013CA2B
MASRATMIVCAGLVATSAVVAGLWTFHGSRSRPDGQPSSMALSSRPAGSLVEADGQSVRTVYPGPLSGAPQRAEVPSRTEPATAAAIAAPAPGVSTAPQVERVAVATPVKPSEETPMPGLAVETAPEGADDRPAAAGPGADLNTASVEELNALGAGMIGRRIVAFRPYASPEDLVNRRVLKKSDFEIIKASVMVR